VDALYIVVLAVVTVDLLRRIYTYPVTMTSFLAVAIEGALWGGLLAAGRSKDAVGIAVEASIAAFVAAIGLVLAQRTRANKP
jgi:hypothetical protein